MLDIGIKNSYFVSPPRHYQLPCMVQNANFEQKGKNWSSARLHSNIREKFVPKNRRKEPDKTPSNQKRGASDKTAPCVFFLSVLIKTAPRNPEEIAEYVPLNLLHPIHITIADLRQIYSIQR